MVEKSGEDAPKLSTAHELAPFRDPAYRAYLDNLRELLNQGLEGGWFVTDSAGVRKASGKTRADAYSEYASHYGGKPTLEIRIEAVDTVQHQKYFQWLEQQSETREKENPTLER